MNPFDIIRDQLNKVIPFAQHVGAELTEVGEGTAVAVMKQRHETSNHIRTQHAGAMFTLGEAASGGALAGAFGPMIFQARPVASGAQISYVKIAKGQLKAHATTERPGSELVKELEEVGKTVFDIAVDIRDADGDTVATMTVGWHVKKM